MRKTAKTKGGGYTVLDLEEVSEIGRGAFGRVLKMKIHSDKTRASKLVAVKNPTDLSHMGLDEIEKNLLMRLDHKNVVKLLYYYMDGVAVNLVLEFMEGGDLFDFLIHNYSKKDGIGIFTEIFAYQLFRGLAYIHSKEVAHRDIKPENLLVSKASGILKIADFGLGTLMHDEKVTHTFYVGTRLFRAPEMLLGASRYSTKVDIWSGGIVLTHMLLAMPIFYQHGMTETRELMVRMFEFLGLPGDEDMEAMKVDKIPLPKKVKRRKFDDAFKSVEIHDRQALFGLLRNVFVYKPALRFNAWQVCDDKYFNRLKQDGVTLPNGNPLPRLFDFTREEIASMPGSVSKSLGSLASE